MMWYWSEIRDGARQLRDVLVIQLHWPLWLLVVMFFCVMCAFEKWLG